MAKPELFISLEESFVDTLSPQWDRAAKRMAKQLAEAVKDDDLAKADKIIESVNTAALYRGKLGKIKQLSMSALLFGATQVTPKAKETKFYKDGKTPAILKPAMKQFKMMLDESDKSIKKAMAMAVQKAIEVRDESVEAVQKAAKVKTIDEIMATGVSVSGQSMINVTASLHTSRMAAYGYCIEAGVRGVTTYQVNEQLDNRICPVCRTMHGKTFEVGPALDKLDRQLSVDDPQDLKTLAPWPKQDKDSVEKLRSMDTGDLVAAGWDTPPYHPGCRGILSQSGSVPSLPTPIPPAKVVDRPAPSQPTVPEVPVVQPPELRPSDFVIDEAIELPVAGETRRFVMPRRAKDSDMSLVVFDATELDRAWQMDKGFYVGTGGTGGKQFKYDQVKEFIEQNGVIEVGEAGVGQDGVLSFINGRHRTAAMRDSGMQVIPVALDEQSLKLAIELGLIVPK